MNAKFLIVYLLILLSNHLIINAQGFDSVKSNADLSFMEGKYENALAMYKSIMNTAEVDSSEIALIYSNAGLCCTKLNKTQDAIKYYKLAVQYNVPQLMIYDKLISLTKDENDLENYEFALLQKLKGFPDFEIEVKQKLAFLYFSNQQYDKLLPVTQLLIEWYPDYAKYYLYDAVAKQNLNDIPGAEESYGKVLELDPDDAGANMGKGLILFNRASAMYDKMKAAYEAKQNPDRVDYSNYRQQIEQPKAIFRESLPFLLKAYENKAYASLKGTIRNCYLRLEEKENADKY